MLSTEPDWQALATPFAPPWGSSQARSVTVWGSGGCFLGCCSMLHPLTAVPTGPGHLWCVPAPLPISLLLWVKNTARGSFCPGWD